MDIKAKSGWNEISKEIFEGAQKNEKLKIVSKLEMAQNREVAYDYVFKLFTSGKKYTNVKATQHLMSMYIGNINNKENFKRIYE